MANPTATNILVGGAWVYYAPVGETPPADSVAYGTAWGGNWARVGFTKEPLSALYEDEQMGVGVEEALTDVKRVKTLENLTLETVLAEVTSTYMNLAVGAGTVTTTAAGAGQVGKDEYAVGGEILLDENAWGFEAMYVSATGVKFPVRVFVWKATSKLNGELAFSKKSGEYPGIALQIMALADTSQNEGLQLFKFQRVTAAATS